MGPTQTCFTTAQAQCLYAAEWHYLRACDTVLAPDISSCHDDHLC